MQTTAVYACVRILAETLAALPLQLYRYTPGGKERVYDHPLYHLLHDEPNPEMTSFIFRETLMSHLLIWGNAYAQIIRDRLGRVQGLYPLRPDKMTVCRDDRGKIFYLYTKTGDENPNIKPYGQVALQKEEVLHIPGLGFDGLVGYSPIAMARNAVGMTMACEEYGASFFANGASPSGVLEHPGVLKDPAKVRDSWNAVYRGTGNAHKVAVLEEGMKYEQIGVPPEEAQFLESRKYSVTEIARIFGVPPHMIADLEHATFSNIESQDINFAKHSIMPECVNWEQELMRKLIRDDEHDRYEIEFVMDGLVRGDIESRYKAYAIGRQWGFLNANDIRAKENMNSVDGGETIYVPLNMIGSDLAAPYWQARIKAYEMQGKEVKNNAGEK